MLTLIHGEALDELRKLPSNSVHCIVTSPPYYGVRDYGTAQWAGGDPKCDHLMPMPGGTRASTLGEYDNGLSPEAIESKVKDRRKQYSGACKKCGANRADRQLGLERTVDAFSLPQPLKVRQAASIGITRSTLE